MSRNPPLFEDVLSAEEHVLGCMCDSFISWAGTNETIFPVSVMSTYESDRIEEPHPLSKKKIYPYIYCVSNLWFSLVWYKFNYLNLLQFKMSKNSPLVTTGYSQSKGNLISKQKKLCSYSYKNGLIRSATQPIFIIKYRYCIWYVNLVMKDLITG